MTAAERIFQEALEDLRAGREEPVERYLDRVPRTEREQLADLLVDYFAARQEPADPRANAELFERTLAAVDRVAAEETATAGVLPGLLMELSRTRGMRRSDIVSALRNALKLPDKTTEFLADLYHRLEAGQVPGRGMQPRLIAALSEVFRLPEDEIEVARIPLRQPRTLRVAKVFGRGGGEVGESFSSGRAEAPSDPQLREVFDLFYGGSGV